MSTGPPVGTRAASSSDILGRMSKASNARRSKGSGRLDCVRFNGLVANIESFARRRGLSSRRLASGAGHDAVYLARTCPSAMIFVPCDGGISHNEIENAQPGDIEAGCNVLLDCVLAEAGGGRTQ